MNSVSHHVSFKLFNPSSRHNLMRTLKKGGEKWNQKQKSAENKRTILLM